MTKKPTLKEQVVSLDRLLEAAEKETLYYMNSWEQLDKENIVQRAQIVALGQKLADAQKQIALFMKETCFERLARKVRSIWP